MFGLGTLELSIIIIIAVLLFGSQLPKMVKKVGKDAKAVKDEIKSVMKDDEEDESKKDSK